MSVSTMSKSPIPDGPTSITASWLNQALSAGVASDHPVLKEVDVEVVGAGVGLMGEVLRCRLTYEDDAPSAPDSVRDDALTVRDGLADLVESERLIESRFGPVLGTHLGPNTIGVAVTRGNIDEA